jgi:hypothetical protein
MTLLKTVIVGFIFFSLYMCSNYSENPYRREMLLNLKDGYISRYYFPLGRTDSVRIYFEQQKEQYIYEDPIAAYSLRNTDEDLFITKYQNDSIIFYYKNSLLNIKQEKNKVESYKIYFKLIDTYEWLHLKNI